MKNLTNFLLESSSQTGKKYRLTDDTTHENVKLYIV